MVWAVLCDVDAGRRFRIEDWFGRRGLGVLSSPVVRDSLKGLLRAANTNHVGELLNAASVFSEQSRTIVFDNSFCFLIAIAGIFHDL